MTTLIEFLRARLDEDEAAARAAGVEHRWVAHTVDGWDGSDVITDRGDGIFTASDGGVADDSIVAHVTRWDPVRALGEVEAKRRIIERHTEKVGANVTPGTCAECGGSDWRVANVVTGRLDPYPWVMPWPCPTIRILAQPYADHPEFTPTWRTA